MTRQTESGRIELRVKPEDKALLRAPRPSSASTSPGSFCAPCSPRPRRSSARRSGSSSAERDSKRVLELLENPPPPSAKLLRAAKAARQRS